ncbi:MAG: response regulator [Bacteroidales bacterium]
MVDSLNKDWHDKTILIAEDEGSNFKYLEIALRKTGVNILHARNGKEAIEITKERSDLELILMDIKMPEMDGLEATKAIRTFNSDIIIVALTAYAMENDRDMSIEAGCNDYIAKPVHQNRLFSVLAKFLDE